MGKSLHSITTKTLFCLNNAAISSKFEQSKYWELICWKIKIDTAASNLNKDAFNEENIPVKPSTILTTFIFNPIYSHLDNHFSRLVGHFGYFLCLPLVLTINLTVLGRVKVIPNIEYYTCRLLSEGGIFYHRKTDWKLLVQNSLAAASIDKSIFIDLGKPSKSKSKKHIEFSIS